MDVSAAHGRLSEAVQDFAGRRHKLLIDGQWVDAKSGKTFAVFDPSNGQQIAQVARAGPRMSSARSPPPATPSRTGPGRG
jgi:hypothetical protein